MLSARHPIALVALATVAAASLAGCQKGATASTAAGAPVAAVAPPAGKQWTDVVTKTADNGTVLGNPNAPVRLVEYGSLTCPHCAKLAGEMMGPLSAQYIAPGKVAYEYHSFAIHGPDIPLTVLVRCADQSAFFALVDALYATQPALIQRMMAGQAQAQAAANLPASQRLNAMSDAMGLTDWFAAHGLAKEKAHACLANTAAGQAVANESDAISGKGINQTPWVIVNGTKIELGETQEMTWDIIQQRLKGAGV